LVEFLVVGLLSLGHVLVDELILVLGLQIDVFDKSEVLQGNLLQDQIHHQREDSEAPAGGDLPLSQRGRSKQGRSQARVACFKHQVLNSQLEEHHQPERWVIEKSQENVHFTSIYHSAVYLVEKSHQDESMEADGIQNKSISWLLVYVKCWSSNYVETLLEEDSLSGVH
jgi:hypothetical protein